MATPAVDEAEDKILGTPTASWSGIAWVPAAETFAVVYRYQRKRPASIENAMRPDGSRPPSDWLSQRFSAVGGWGRREVWANGNPFFRLFDGYIYAPPNHTMSFFQDYAWDSGLQYRAVQKALEKLKDSKVNLGVALAEARKTAELLAGTSQTIAQQLDLFMAKNWKKLGKFTSW